MFDNKILLITGGTGSFGNAVLKGLINSELKEIRIFSRDEEKQDAMRNKYNNNKLKFYIGDVRDKRSIDNVMFGVNYVFHAAALKQVPSCEFFPIQAVKTNIFGTENVIDSAIENNVSSLIVLSTDKAVYPINAMGMSKALMEKVMVSKSMQNYNIKICGTRYGNVMTSRGSVIPLFVDQIKNNKPITITDPNMTRYMMTLDNALDLVLYAFENGNNGDIFVQKAPAVTIGTLAKALKELYKSDVPIEYIGTRHGEKLYETLVNREEMVRAIDLGNYYQIPSDNRELNYKQYISSGSNEVSTIEEYHSHNTKRLEIEDMKKILLKLEIIKKDCR
ncbi:MAG: polysaccharide biosynthesis protein [Gammaproteobacteria bacterium]|jgi:UDP-N-acetylglucosamine 4,6-dehydratase/5-epimerase|nr:polysaccharide biosynthesis protein [Gammaproteobacteria bacterium]